MGRFTGSAPPFAAWPFYEAADVTTLEEKDPELEIYKAGTGAVPKCSDTEGGFAVMTCLLRWWTLTPQAA